MDARAYLQARPLDPAGWLAATGASLGKRATPDARDLEVIAAARELAPHDPQVMRADAHLAFAAGDVATGLERTADIALMLPTESDAAYATIAARAEHPAFAEFIARRTAARWAGLNPLLLHACRSQSPLATVVRVASQIYAKQPLSDEVVTCIGERAISAGDMATARTVWLNGSERLPRTIAHVFNGDFELPGAGRLFDWRISVGGEYREGFVTGVRAEGSGARINRLLSVRFNRRPIRSGIALQYLALEPGRYALSYRMRGSTQPPAQLAWAVSCLPGKPGVTVTQSPETTEAAGEDWLRKRSDLVVPPACAGQQLELVVADKLQTLRGLAGELALDDISIVRK